MVKAILALSLLLSASSAFALLPQTQQDLRVFEDRLRYEIDRARERGDVILPVLVATPRAHWEESKTDFAAAVTDVLTRLFPNPGEMIACAECFDNRVFVSRDNRMVIQSGELTLADLARLREKPGFNQAKSVFISRETPSGIEMRLIAIDDGRLLYTGLADATRDLSTAERPLRLARELERRERGESLSYFHFDLGLYPQGLVQLKWLEQWGSRNQHLSGVALSAFNPTGAIGITYLYMWPRKKQITVGVTGYYGLSGVFDAGSTDLSKNIIGQLSVNYAFSGAYGVFASCDTKGTASVGLSFQNPVFLPFLF